MNKYFRWAFPIMLLGLIVLWGCSKGPTSSQITALVKQDMQHHVPPRLAATIMPGSNAVISEIQVKKIGEVQTFNSKEYYPAMVYSKGTCDAILGNKVPFEGEWEYYFWKTAYGEWTVTHLKENIGR